MSESDILALIRGYATIPYRIYIEGKDTPLDEYEIVSTTYEDYRYVDTDSLVIGQFVARTFNGEIKNINRDLLIENKEIEVRMGVKVGDTTTWYSLGNFLITKPEEDDVKDKMTFKSMDYTKKFNQKFDPTLVTFPCTALELATAVCNQCGVELATTDFTNSNFIIENNQYVNNESCRKVMQDIGKTAYSWVRIGWDNKCYIDFEVKTEVEDHNIITNDEYYDFSKQQKQFGVVNRVVIGMKDVDGENVAVQDDDSIAENGLCELHIYDNNLTYTPELRQQVIEGAKRLFGLKYVPVEVNTVGHPWLIGNELVRIIDMDGNAIDTYPFDRTIEYMGHIKTKLVSKAETQTQHDYVNNNTLGDLLNRTKIVVDKQNQTIKAVAEQSDASAKKVAEFGITLDEISSSVSNTEEVVKDLENSIDLFSVDLSQYTLTIPTDSTKKPLETKNYDINFYGYFKGKQVVPSVAVDNSNAGITTSTTSTYIRFSVDMNNIITNLTNNYILTFTYNSPDGVYKLTKGVTVTLSTQGKDGTSVNILGSYNSLEELKQAHPTGNVGDAYIVQGDMYVWSVEDNTWIDVGDIQGPPGTNGKDGENGKSSYQIWLEQGNTGSEQDYLNSLKGEDGEDGYTPIKGKDYFDGKDGVDGYTPIKGIDYFDGTNGKDGTPAYFYVRYSANANGNPMTTTPQSNTEYMGTANTTSPTPPTSYSAYTWVKIKGKDGIDGVDGTNGTPGQDGENGLTPYLHIKYSEDGITFTPADEEYALGEKPSAWFGQYVDYSEADSNDFDDYEWYKFTEDIDPKLEELQDGINDANESINNTNLEVVQLKTDVTQDRESFRVSVEQLTQTIDTNNANVQNNLDNINNILANGVETLKNTLVTINIDGISVATNVSKISTLITNNTFAITSSGTNLAYFGYDEENGTSIAEMDNLTIHNYFTAGYHRTEKFEINGEKRTGVFYVGGDE